MISVWKIINRGLIVINLYFASFASAVMFLRGDWFLFILLFLLFVLNIFNFVSEYELGDV